MDHVDANSEEMRSFEGDRDLWSSVTWRRDALVLIL